MFFFLLPFLLSFLSFFLSSLRNIDDIITVNNIFDVFFNQDGFCNSTGTELITEAEELSLVFIKLFESAELNEKLYDELKKAISNIKNVLKITYDPIDLSFLLSLIIYRILYKKKTNVVFDLISPEYDQIYKSCVDFLAIQFQTTSLILEQSKIKLITDIDPEKINISQMNNFPTSLIPSFYLSEEPGESAKGFRNNLQLVTLDNKDKLIPVITDEQRRTFEQIIGTPIVSETDQIIQYVNRPPSERTIDDTLFINGNILLNLCRSPIDDEIGKKYYIDLIRRIFEYCIPKNDKLLCDILKKIGFQIDSKCDEVIIADQKLASLKNNFQRLGVFFSELLLNNDPIMLEKYAEYIKLIKTIFDDFGITTVGTLNSQKNNTIQYSSIFIISTIITIIEFAKNQKQNLIVSDVLYLLPILKKCKSVYIKLIDIYNQDHEIKSIQDGIDNGSEALSSIFESNTQIVQYAKDYLIPGTVVEGVNPGTTILTNGSQYMNLLKSVEYGDDLPTLIPPPTTDKPTKYTVVGSGMSDPIFNDLLDSMKDTYTKDMAILTATITNLKQELEKLTVNTSVDEGKKTEDIVKKTEDIVKKK